MVDHFADDKQGGIWQGGPIGVIAPRLGRLNATLLLVKTAFGHHCDGCVGFAELNQPHRDVSEAPPPHEHHQGGGRVQRVKEVLGHAAVLTCCGAEPRRRCHAAKGQGDANETGKRSAAGNSRNVRPAEADLVCVGEFFTRATKHHGVASFESNNAKALLGTAVDPIVNECLRGAGLTCTFSHANQLRLGVRQVKDILVHQAIVEHKLGLRQCACPFEGHQFRVTGAGTDQPKVGLGGWVRASHVKKLWIGWGLGGFPTRPKTWMPFPCRHGRSFRCCCRRGRTALVR